MTGHPVRALPTTTRKPDSDTITPVAEPGEVNSTQLFAGAKEMFIRHGGERYTLHLTSKGKLILTK